MNLLDKTRKIAQLVKPVQGIDHLELLQTGSDLTQSNCYLIHPDGKIFKAAVRDEMEFDCIQTYLSQGSIPSEILEDLQVDHTETHVKIKKFPNDCTMVVPLLCEEDLLGLLVFVRQSAFSEEDIIIGEYVSTLLRIVFQLTQYLLTEQNEKKRRDAQLAVESLSFTELKAAEHIFQTLDGIQGVLVASKVADRFGITRSVIVNALRKLESAGIVQSQSLGMKGTFIKICNSHLLTTLEDICSKQNN